MKKWMFLACALSPAAFGANVTLQGEYGCDDPATQQARATLMRNIASDNPHYVAQREEMTESLLNISKYQCRPLNGTFKVISRKSGYTQVAVPGGAQWIAD